jgi:hypothetical protein
MRPAVVACLALWTVSGPFCTGSEQVIAGAGDAAADSMVEGRWREAGDTTHPTRIIITRDSASTSASYLVTYVPDSGAPLHDRLILTHIGGVLFGDLYPVKDEERWNTIPVHLFLRTDASRSQLVVNYMDPRWLRAYIKVHRQEIHTVTLDDWIILTDSTAKVRRFLLSTLNIKDAYGNSTVYVRLP